MAKTSKYKVPKVKRNKDNPHRAVMRRLVNNFELKQNLNLADIADDLYNYYIEAVPHMDGWQVIDQNRFTEKIAQIFTTEDIDFLMFMHVGKGIIIGSVMALCAVEDSIQGQLDDRFSEDDEPTEEELEELVGMNVFGAGFGGNDGTDAD